MDIRCSICGQPAVMVGECADGDRPVCASDADRVAITRRNLPKIGPAMLAVLIHVYANPGSTKGQAAKATGNVRLAAGYAAVDRVIQAGLVTPCACDEDATHLVLSRLGELITPYPNPTP